MASSEKQPWGRSLAAFFPCCYKETHQPEIRFVQENPTLQEPKLPPPPPLQELDSMFAGLVVRSGARVNVSRLTLTLSHCLVFSFQDELELSEEHREAMFSLPAEKKWQIYCSKKAVRSLLVHLLVGSRPFVMLHQPLSTGGAVWTLLCCGDVNAVLTDVCEILGFFRRQRSRKER